MSSVNVSYLYESIHKYQFLLRIFTTTKCELTSSTQPLKLDKFSTDNMLLHNTAAHIWHLSLIWHAYTVHALMNYLHYAAYFPICLQVELYIYHTIFFSRC